MVININTDNHVEGRQSFTERASSIVEAALARFRDRITRVEVHVTDQNAGKGGERDKRCVIEARLANRQPTAVTHAAGTVNAAVQGAAAKLVRAIDSVVGRLRDERGHSPRLPRTRAEAPSAPD